MGISFCETNSVISIIEFFESLINDNDISKKNNININQNNSANNTQNNVNKNNSYNFNTYFSNFIPQFPAPLYPSTPLILALNNFKDGNIPQLKSNIDLCQSNKNIMPIISGFIHPI